MTKYFKITIEYDGTPYVGWQAQDNGHSVQAAIEAATSGHLVLSTLHGNDAIDAMERIVNAFDFPQQPFVRQQLTNALRAVLGQRLVHEKYGKDRYPATEIMFGTLQIKNLLNAGRHAEAFQLIEKGSSYGMHTFDQDLFQLVNTGLISPQEALNNASRPNDLRLKLQNQGGANLDIVTP